MAVLPFLRAKTATAFSASLPSQFCQSVCLSVRPSVTRMDQSKTVKLKLLNIHRRLPGRL